MDSAPGRRAAQSGEPNCKHREKLTASGRVVVELCRGICQEVVDIGAQVAFDPYASEVLTLPRNGRGMVYLGGVAMPPAQLPSGAYAGTITVTLSYLGN